MTMSRHFAPMFVLAFAGTLAAAGSLADADASSVQHQQVLYVANGQSADVSVLLIGNDGQVAADPRASLSPGQDSIVSGILASGGAFLMTAGSAASNPLGAELRGLRLEADGSMSLQPTLTATIDVGVSVMATAHRNGRTFVYLFPFEPMVHAFELVDAAAGPEFAPVAGQPFASPGFTYFGDAAVTPDGRFLYVGKAFDAGLTGFAIADDGALSILSMPQLAALDHFRAVTISPDGRHLYAATHGVIPGAQTSHVRAYAIGGNGLLAELAGSPFLASPFNPDRVTDLSVSPDGSRVVALNFISRTISLLRRGADGSLVPTSQTDPFSHQLIAAEASDSHAYVLAQDCTVCEQAAGSGVFVLSINADDSLGLRADQPVPAGIAPVSLSLRLGRPDAAPSGDLDGNGFVNGIDLGILLAQWGILGGGAADLNGDRIVNGIDLGILLGQWK